MAKSSAQIEQWLVAAFSERAGQPVEATSSLIRLGLDSAVILELVGLVGTELGIDADPEIFWEHDTIRSLATHLAELTEGRDEAAGRDEGA